MSRWRKDKRIKWRRIQNCERYEQEKKAIRRGMELDKKVGRRARFIGASWAWRGLLIPRDHHHSSCSWRWKYVHICFITTSILLFFLSFVQENAVSYELEYCVLLSVRCYTKWVCFMPSARGLTASPLFSAKNWQSLLSSHSTSSWLPPGPPAQSENKLALCEFDVKHWYTHDPRLMGKYPGFQHLVSYKQPHTPSLLV